MGPHLECDVLNTDGGPDTLQTSTDLSFWLQLVLQIPHQGCPSPPDPAFWGYHFCCWTTWGAAANISILCPCHLGRFAEGGKPGWEWGGMTGGGGGIGWPVRLLFSSSSLEDLGAVKEGGALLGWQSCWCCWGWRRRGGEGGKWGKKRGGEEDQYKLKCLCFLTSLYVSRVGKEALLKVIQVANNNDNGRMFNYTTLCSLFLSPQ